MSGEAKRRDAIAGLAKSLFDRGLTHGSTGNISVRLDDGWLMTPSGASLGALDPAALSRLDDEGALVSGAPATIEKPLHLAVYGARPGTGAVVHLHCTHSVAVSCLDDVDPANVLPPLTAYYAIKVGTLPLVPFHPPGSDALAQAVAEKAAGHAAVLLANHGPVVAGKTLEDAVHAAEELEQTARIYLMTRGMKTRALTPDQVAELERLFPS